MRPITKRNKRSSMGLLLFLSTTTLFSPTDATSKRDTWYKRYEVYPPYCSTPEQMTERTIPPITNTKGVGESHLVHVTAVLRHGARTPYMGNMNCWEGYQQADTGTWNCDLTTYLSPPPPDRIDAMEGDDPGTDAEAMFLFEKTYDALLDPADQLSNHLYGTCELGQLLLRGYEQELVNGQNLRSAYVYDGHNYQSDSRLRLFDLSNADGKYTWHPENLYYRVDDDQRTLMSGQVILRGLFENEIIAYYKEKKVFPVIPLHTADRDRDIVDPNEAICPRLQEIRERFERSNEFQAFNKSTEANLLREFQTHVLKIQPDMVAIDCLMTTICTDRFLPDAVNDYTGESVRRVLEEDMGNSTTEESTSPSHNETESTTNATATSTTTPSTDSYYGKNLFQRLYNFEVDGYALRIKANDAEYAKLGIGPLWAEIMTNIYGITGQDPGSCCPDRPVSKLAIFAGHDTTIMPLLASLGERVWDGEWPPYASMMLIEMHEVHIDGQTDSQIYRSNFAFRLIYNGKVLTHLVDGCPEDAELCDARILVDRVKPFATRHVQCDRMLPPPKEYMDPVSRVEQTFSTAGGIALFVFIVLSSAFMGAIAMFFILTGSLPRKRASHVTGDDVIALTGQRYSDDPETVDIYDADENDDDDDEVEVYRGTNGTYS